MKFSSTEPKFDIFIKNITGKNTFLNSKNAFLYFARLFRPWVISARAVSAPSYFNLWIFLSRIEDVANKTNKFQGSIFLFIYFKDKKEHSSECHSIKNTFFLKKNESHRFS